MKKLRESKIYKIIKTILNVIITVCFLFLIVVCLQRFSNNKISLFNYRMFTVASGSMEPEYNIGDVLIAKKKDADKIKVGDTISYLGEKGGFKDKVITHRVEYFRTLQENILYSIINHQVYITLTVAQLLILQAVEFFGQRQ